MSAEPVGQLAQALDAAGQLVAAVRAEQWPDPTPCPDWNGRDLVSHIIAGDAPDDDQPRLAACLELRAGTRLP